MDEHQEYERHDVDKDWDGGVAWIGGEAFSSGRKHKRQQTKEDQLYGVFLDSGSDEEERRSKRGGAGPKDYSRPVGFVSSGLVNKQPEEEDQHAEAGPSNFDVKGLPGLGQEGTGGLGSAGVGAGGAGGGLGFRSGGTQSGKPAEEQEEDDEGVLATAYGARVKKRVEERRHAEKQERKVEKKRQDARAADPQFATFEKHTKGIGMKLLMKMGYKPGEGLGRDKSGINKPIEVVQRQKGQALGFGVKHRDDSWEEERASRAAAAKADAADVQKSDQQPGRGGPSWKKKNQEARVKREYRSAEEVVRAAAERPGTVLGVTAQPILDMRGPQVRLVTNLEHLNMQQEEQQGADRTPMPELQHNLQLLVDLCEADIQRLDARLRHEQDTATLVARERERLEAEERQQQSELARLQQVMDLVERCQSGGKAGTSLPLDQLEGAYRQLYTSYREEYVMYCLAATALVQVLPPLTALMKGWAPLSEPSRGVDTFRRWRPLLEPPGASGPLGGGGGSHAADDPYLTLVTELVLPPLRSACTAWEPREPEPLLQFLEAWDGALPGAALGHVLGMLVMPRLRHAVEQWEPRQETVPIHRWLHPWLPYLGPQLEELYPGIRHKLAVALQAWHPSDVSALALLQPWHRVFSASEWDALLLKSIVPKLHLGLQQLVVDPSAQDMAPFLWLTSWHEVLPIQHMVTLLEHGFFPKWHQVLHFWLSHSPNYDEVTRWYLGWKSYLPPQVLDHERVRQQFNMALDAMNSAVEGRVPATAASAAAAGPQVPFATRWATDGAAAGPAAAPAAAPLGPSAIPSAADLTLRDLVQRYAEEHSVPFMPKFGRFHDGLQVYSFGGISVVLDNTSSMVRAQLRDRWAPVSLETLLQQARLLG